MIQYTAAYYRDQATGWYTAKVLDFPGVLTQGKTLDHARKMLADALRAMTEWYVADGEPVPAPQPGSTDPSADVIEPIQLIIRARSGMATQ